MLRDVENATIYSSGRCAVWRAGQAENRELGGSRGGFLGISQSGSRVRMWQAMWLFHAMQESSFALKINKHHMLC